MATPTISSATANHEQNIDVVFSVPVAVADSTGLTASINGSVVAVTYTSGTTTDTISFAVPSMKSTDTVTISFAATNTITAVTGGESLAETLLEAVTNSVTDVTDAAQQTSQAIHTATAVLARDTKTACRAAC